MDEKYRSRKFMVTVGGVLLASVLAFMGKLTPELSNVILTAIGAYNVANAWAGGK